MVDLKKFLALSLILLSPMDVHSTEESKSSSGKEENHELGAIFKENSVEGTIVIASLDGKKTYIHNIERADTRLCPASTFKIANSLIALETAVVKDDHEVIKWDGQKRFLDEWNRDQNLNTAFKYSCVWAYQRFAENIGTDRYKKFLKKLNYGNQIPGPELTSFWLTDGALRITPFEQIVFLKDIVLKKHPLQNKSYEILKKIMLQEETPDYKLYWKTGAATKDWKGHGWYIGYVEKNGETWFFATNILISSIDDLPLREKVTRECLKTLKII
ncbi:MAG: class D beta-lactamase [Simkaniaceae bacterium]|nr:class D beta-lactamase [Simkaniaceae bacterium]